MSSNYTIVWNNSRKQAEVLLSDERPSHHDEVIGSMTKETWFDFLSWFRKNNISAPRTAGALKKMYGRFRGIMI